MGPPQSSFHTCYGCKVSVGFAAFAYRGLLFRPEAKAFAVLGKYFAFRGRDVPDLTSGDGLGRLREII